MAAYLLKIANFSYPVSFTAIVQGSPLKFLKRLNGS